jgi:PAS domain S-box-containing protein/diguanylate cyclase (GGDEF)-like protein
MLELTPEVYSALLESLPNGVYAVDRQRRIRFWNSAAERISGYLRHEVIGRACPDNLLQHCDEQNHALCHGACPLRETIHDGRTRDVDLFLRHKNGQRLPVRVRSAAIRDERGNVQGAVESFEERAHVPAPDIRAHSPAANVDPLTGVPGHDSIASRLQEALSGFERDGIPCAALVIAVDGLDALTHSHGRLAAEAMLRLAAQTLEKNRRSADLVGRWSEDRFMMVVEQCPPAGLPGDAARTGRILEMLALPWWSDELPLSARIGAASAQHGDTLSTLIARAEGSLAKCGAHSQPGVSN